MPRTAVPTLIVVLGLYATAFADEPRADPEEVRRGPLTAAAALETFEIAAGFRVELVAAEPLVRDPVAIDFDERGRLYVVEYPEFNQYSFSAESQRRPGAIKLLEDTDDDGVFDKSTTFVDRIDFPSAVACYDGGVFIGAAPHLIYCQDTDGDGRADIREVVLTGFARDFAGGGLLNSFRWGLDNRLHIATSFAGGNVRRATAAADKALSVNGRGVVLDPRTKTFETTSGGGQNGMGVDDWGFKYLCSNVNPIQLLMYDTRYAKRNPYFAPRNPAVNINAAEGAKLHRISPLEPWRVVRSKRVADARGDDDEGAHPGGRFTSASGVTIYRGDAWPKEYRGDLFVGEVANNLVYRARLSYDGLGVTALRADEEREFLASTDTWFRPVQFANAPDGNLYVVDMYRELIEGAAFVPPELLANLDPRNGSDRGRIYRIRATGEANAEPAATTRRLPKRADVAALAQLLDHENGWHRDTASRLLSEVGDVAAARDLKRIARESQRPQGRIHALYALQELDRLSEAMLLSGLRDESPFVRLHAIRLCESANRDSVELRGQLHSMVADPNERVRFQLAQTLGEFPGVRTQESLAKLLDQDGGDPWMRDAVQSSLRDSAGAVLLQLASSPDFHRRPFAAEVLSGLAKQIGSQNRRSDIALLAGAVQAISVKDIELQRRVLQVALLNATPAVRRQLADDEQWAAETKELIEAAPAAALDAQRDLAARIDAARLLAVVDLDDEGVLDALRRLLHWRQAKSLQSAVIEALGRHRDRERTPQLLLAAWPTLSPALRMQAAEVLFSRTSWTIAVLDAIDRDAIDETEISASRVASLLNHENAGVRSRARRLSESASQVDRQVVLQRYSSAIGRRGDIDRGKNVFKNNCSACHQLVDARGLQISAGPLLAGIGDKRQSVVLTHILDPNREVSPKYLNFVVAMDDGRSVAGMIVSETSNGLQLQRADGQRIDILRLRVESMKSTGVSFMPEGLEKQISVPGMADLLAYLSTIR